MSTPSPQSDPTDLERENEFLRRELAALTTPRPLVGSSSNSRDPGVATFRPDRAGTARVEARRRAARPRNTYSSPGSEAIRRRAIAANLDRFGDEVVGNRISERNRPLYEDLLFHGPDAEGGRAGQTELRRHAVDRGNAEIDAAKDAQFASQYGNVVDTIMNAPTRVDQFIQEIRADARPTDPGRPTASNPPMAGPPAPGPQGPSNGPQGPSGPVGPATRVRAAFEMLPRGIYDPDAPAVLRSMLRAPNAPTYRELVRAGVPIRMIPQEVRDQNKARGGVGIGQG